MAKKASARRDTGFAGRWRLTWMSEWENDFMDEEVRAFIKFAPAHDGEFHFGYVRCGIDWEPEERGEKPGVAFSFEGFDEMTPTTGRGWAVLEPDGTMTGQLHFHQGDKSKFRAQRERGG